MALLCRHDRVLWMANMKSKGEKQFYVLALLETLFQHLPDDVMVAILYDIACQLHRSLHKWGFLAPFITRMVFAVAVFHAFVHRLECQLRYHPWKREGLGFTSGEGCERLWHQLSRLIGHLRISGSYHRLYTLNAQVQFIEQNSLRTLGAWISRRQAFSDEKREMAQAILAHVATKGFDRDALAKQWDLQVEAQTKPHPNRSKRLGIEAVNEVLALREEKKCARVRVEEAQEAWDNASEAEEHSRLMARSALLEAKMDLESIEESLKQKEAALGIDSRARLNKAKSNKFFEQRMNALALKTRIRDLLRSRNMELSELKRSGHRQQGSSDWKLRNAIASSVSKRLPRIRRLVGEFNKLCAKLADMAIHNQAPRGAKIPVPIVTKKVPNLDVDDKIWDDVGLTDEDSSSAPPDWLVNESVKEGIKALLDERRALEEDRFLRNERRSMKAWFQEEWSVINHAICTAGDPALQYQFEIRRVKLIELCADWRKDLPAEDFETNWGPSDSDLSQAQEKMHQRHRNGDPVNSDELSVIQEDVCENDSWEWGGPE
ncbi:unnamed protein product [Mycena citricolor]|uniref:Uncharacterized protein n=1 Tax=Mycena citricolor TaxID=2018698 RepID=A0AAD2HW45_9AGAR|nr:unnamed protein product [Mycena citricolor]